MKIYLGHPFNSREKVNEWEKKLKTKHEICNPFYPQRVYEKFKSEDVAGEEYYKQLDPTRIVEEDLKLIDNCDVVFGVIDGALSYGTILEMGYAKSKGMLIYIICTNGHQGHPWIVYYAEKVFTTFREAKEWLEK